MANNIVDQVEGYARSIRSSILSVAERLTSGSRNTTYGNPTDNMQAFAHLLTGYLRSRQMILARDTITAEDAAVIMALGKIARLWSTNLPYHEDNYVDAAAYLAMAGEAAAKGGRSSLQEKAPEQMHEQMHEQMPGPSAVEVEAKSKLEEKLRQERYYRLRAAQDWEV